jgi:hypothetical protein
MWMVSYSKSASVQGEASTFIPRSTLPTNDQCETLTDAMDAQEAELWALAMRLKRRAGLRWGELTALRPVDFDFQPLRRIRVERAVEQLGELHR